MRVLPRVVVPLAVLGTVGVACVTGCSQFDKSLGQQQALISFKSGTSVADRLHVRTACGNLPHVTPAPIAKGVPLASAVDEIVYSVTGASDADIARLQECLTKFPSVQGMDLQDSSDDS